MTSAQPERERGTAPSIEDLVRSHSGVVRAQALRLTCGDHAWADDVVQETFIRAWHRVDRMIETYGSVRGWLLRVCRNLVMDGYRRQRADPRGISEVDLGPAPVPDDSDRLVDAVTATSALATLSRNHRVVLESIYLRDQSIAETARELDLPVGTVKSRAHYALRQLRA